MSGGNIQYTNQAMIDMKKLYNRYNKLPEYWQGYVNAIFDRFNEETKNEKTK